MEFSCLWYKNRHSNMGTLEQFFYDSLYKCILFLKEQHTLYESSMSLLIMKIICQYFILKANVIAIRKFCVLVPYNKGIILNDEVRSCYKIWSSKFLKHETRDVPLCRWLNSRGNHVTYRLANCALIDQEYHNIPLNRLLLQFFLVRTNIGITSEL